MALFWRGWIAGFSPAPGGGRKVAAVGWGFRASGLLAGLLVTGCHTDMWVQPQTKALDPNSTFASNQSARVPPADSIPFSADTAEGPFETGLANGQPVVVAPVDQAEKALSLSGLKALLERGEEQFDVFCSPCHGRLGDGHGMIAQRGLKLVRQPRNLHTDRIVNAPDGHLFRVITHGFGAMFPYGDRVSVADRWAIVAYIRALQLSQGAKEDFGAP